MRERVRRHWMIEREKEVERTGMGSRLFDPVWRREGNEGRERDRTGCSLARA